MGYFLFIEFCDSVMYSGHKFFMWFAHIFSLSVPFHSLSEQHLLKSWYVLILMSYGLCFWWLWNHCLTQGHKDFSYVYSQSSIVFILIFRYMIHFELICMYDIRNGLKYYFFFANLLKKLSWHPLLKIDWSDGYRFVLGFSVLVHLSMYLFWSQCHTIPVAF